MSLRLKAQLIALLGALTPTLLWAASPIIPQPPNVAATSYLLVDATTLKVLAEKSSRERKAPASLTKIMTSYVIEEELQAGRLSAEEKVEVSVNAWRMGGSRMFIREGTQVQVSELLKGIVIQSGNDASVALAEHIAGSEESFAQMMNQQAIAIGMQDSNFRNSTGLPDEDHYSTAWDLALLTQALIENHPEHYALYAQKSYTYNDITQPNRNRLLWRDRSVDGVKTGYTQSAGYCLVASAERAGMRLISVVLGTANDTARMRESQKLLTYGFRNYETRALYENYTELQEERVFYGEAEKTQLGVSEDIVLTIPRGHFKDVEAKLNVPEYLQAPLSRGDVVGQIDVTLDGESLYQGDVVVITSVPESGPLDQLSDYLHLTFMQLFPDD